MDKNVEFYKNQGFLEEIKEEEKSNQKVQHIFGKGIPIEIKKSEITDYDDISEDDKIALEDIADEIIILGDDITYDDLEELLEKYNVTDNLEIDFLVDTFVDNCDIADSNIVSQITEWIREIY